MNGTNNENQLILVKEHEIDKPNNHKMDSIIDSCSRDCLIKHFHTFKYKGVNDINFTNIANNEIINITISGKEMKLPELNKKLKISRENGFVFNQINFSTIKFYSSLTNTNEGCYLKIQIPIMYRQFFRIISQNPEHVETFCNDLNIHFNFVCQKWILENSS